MIHLSLSRALLIVFSLSNWSTGQTKECGNLQYEFDNRCCKKCPPGTFLKEFCTKTQETTCVPCQEGSYADKYHAFDRCERCPSCQQGYAVKCNKTTSGNCSCPHGFLCMDNLCSRCEENKCTAGETPKRIDLGLKLYSYRCEPKCPGNQYFDAKENTCKPWTQCSVKGLVEMIPGNKTHDSVCAKPGTQRDDRDSLYWIMSISFVLLSLSLFLFAFYTCLKSIRRNQRNNAASKTAVQAVSPKTSDFHLSKEESGFKLIIQDESKDCSCVSQQNSLTFPLFPEETI